MIGQQEANEILQNGYRLPISLCQSDKEPLTDCVIYSENYVTIVRHNCHTTKYTIYEKINSDSCELVAWGYKSDSNNKVFCSVRHQDIPSAWANPDDMLYVFTNDCYCKNWKCKLIKNDENHNLDYESQAITKALFGNPSYKHIKPAARNIEY